MKLNPLVIVLLIGGGLAAVYFLSKRSGTTATNQVTTTTSNTTGLASMFNTSAFSSLFGAIGGRGGDSESASTPTTTANLSPRN